MLLLEEVPAVTLWTDSCLRCFAQVGAAVRLCPLPLPPRVTTYLYELTALSCSLNACPPR